ncbi:RagB/SusD family nutrient uptake outer membrane protein [Cellulophaga sp. F20128]|uniref:RagB/SusD family nutrient uptake outer membrane protein n=1 Tax=Cellulophaga sp. F20128 TaxID=2926413 RepID=UPI001FF17015|nr:RagB/SusD family nutrient uptake outer membrane protein [Cellulophaga sp. F20128]MCK0156349.1 RagB/SusD family nutrient uptake outer membrane protein [Cellulophaga sp. F20128]
MNKQFVEKVILKIKNLLPFLLLISCISCTDFIQVDPPLNTLISETVFKDAATVESAFANIYVKMRDQGMVSGSSGLGAMMGLYSDELDYYLNDINYSEIYQNHVSASNTIIYSWWSEAYKLIYAANDILKGVENSDALSAEDRDRFKGQALFVRGYMHSLLTSIFGDVPYITTTNYVENNKVSRTPAATVYNTIIADLTEAVELLKDSDSAVERVIPNKEVANALLARMYLYTENWELAEATATKLINTYTFESNIQKVFLKNSSGSIWQLKPDGVSNRNTSEANQFIIRFIPGQLYAMNNNLLDAFEPGDLRRTHWISNMTSSDGLVTLNYAHKYKALFNVEESMEYSIIFRLAEQYLIRSEARLHLGNIPGSQNDLNRIRNRAELPNTTAETQEELLSAILQERAVEFFTEHGHRWFDLKRMGRAKSVLEPIKLNWSDKNLLLPIPEKELEFNSNLKPQNTGY